MSFLPDGTYGQLYPGMNSYEKFRIDNMSKKVNELYSVINELESQLRVAKLRLAEKITASEYERLNDMVHSKNPEDINLAYIILEKFESGKAGPGEVFGPL